MIHNIVYIPLLLFVVISQSTNQDTANFNNEKEECVERTTEMDFKDLISLETSLLKDQMSDSESSSTISEYDFFNVDCEFNIKGKEPLSNKHLFVRRNSIIIKTLSVDSSDNYCDISSDKSENADKFSSSTESDTDILSEDISINEKEKNITNNVFIENDDSIKQARFICKNTNEFCMNEDENIDKDNTSTDKNAIESIKPVLNDKLDVEDCAANNDSTTTSKSVMLKSLENKRKMKDTNKRVSFDTNIAFLHDN